MINPEKGISVKQLERSTPASSRRHGLAALLAAAFGGDSGSGAPARRLGAAIGLLALLVAIVVSSASADSRIGEPWIVNNKASSAPGVIASGPLAVSAEQGGDVYEISAGILQRVSQFEPDGAFVRAFGWGIVPGAATGTGDTTAGSTSITNAVTTSGSFANSGLGAIAVLGGKAITGPGIPPGTLIEAVTQNEIQISKAATSTASGVALSVAAGPGNVPVNEQQQLVVKATGGKFRLTFISLKPGSTSLATPELPYNASAAEVEAALTGLASIGSGNVSVSGGPGNATGSAPYLIEFKGRFADTNVRELVAANLSLTGGSPSSEVSVTTPRQGGGVVEACTTACSFPGAEENALQGGGGFTGSGPGQLEYNDAIAVDNDSSSASYGDVYLVDQHHFRVVKYGPSGEFLLMFGDEVDKTTDADVCTKADLEGGDECGLGVSGTGPAQFYNEPAGGNNCLEGKPGRSFGCEHDNSIAVGPDGTVYVGDFGRIQEFEPDGAYKGEFTLPVGPGEEPQFVTSLAIDSSGNIFVRSSTFAAVSSGIPADEAPGVREFDSAHNLVRTLDASGEPIQVAVDDSGDVFISEFRSSEAGTPVGNTFEFPAQFLAYKPNGDLYAEFTSDQVINREARNGPSQYSRASNNPAGIAVGGSSLFASSDLPGGEHIAAVPLPKPGPPTIKKQSVTDVEATTATLRAVLNAQGYDTRYHFEYISDKAFEENVEHSEPGFTGATETTEGDIGIIIRDTPVAAAISSLQPETGYHFRAVAENSEGTVSGGDQHFETLPPLSLRGFTTQTVGPELVELKADINPNNGTGPESSGGTYTFRYGKDQTYKGGSVEGSLEIGNEFQTVSATFTGLEPNTKYHYQLTAGNSNGAEKSADGTFTTELSTAEERALENCPNTNLREQDNALALPDCRDYEQVTPKDKRGYAVLKQFTAPSGERVEFESLGAFTGTLDGINYVAERTPEGWVSRAAGARVAGPEYQPKGYVEGFTAEYESSLFPLVKASSAQEAEETTAPNVLYMGRADGSFDPATPVLAPLSGARPRGNGWDKVVAASSDMSTLYVLTQYRLLAGDPLPDSKGGANRIYRITNGGPEPTLELAAEVPSGLSGYPEAGNCSLDSEFERGLNSTSEDGSVLVYDAPVELLPGASCDSHLSPGPNKIALYASVDGGQPIALSLPPAAQCQEPAPCATAPIEDAQFAGMSPDGSLVWFTTAQPLVNADTDNANDLYVARIENGQLGELVKVTNAPSPGEGVELQGLFGVSQDGNRAAFVAQAALTEKPNGSGEQAEAGADNLYAYDLETAQTEFVARVCSAPGESGAVEDSSCPKETTGSDTEPADTQLWNYGEGGSRQRQITPDGGFLLFQSVGRLTADDTDNSADIYRFNYATGQLNRISIGRRGNDGDGNDNAYEAEILAAEGALGYRLDAVAGNMARAIADNGAVAVFMTAAPLVSRDTNASPESNCQGSSTGCDTYEWEEQGHGTCTEPGGCTSLISSGTDPHPAKGLISATGQDITFLSPLAFVPGDEDGVGDVYDARVDGGFHFTPPPAPCGGLEICRPAPLPQPAPPKITTENDTGGNGPRKVNCAKGRHRATRHGQVRCVPNKKHHKKKHRHRSHNQSGGK